MRPGWLKVTVELSSVNRKQSEISVLLPRELEVLEEQIRDVIQPLRCARPRDGGGCRCIPPTAGCRAGAAQRRAGERRMCANCTA